MNKQHARTPYRLSFKVIRTSVVIAALLALTAISLQAASGGGYLLNWWTVDSGGVTAATGGGYSLGATTGQADADPQAGEGGGYSLNGGFWNTSPAEPAGVIISRVWTDENRNGIRDASEVGLNGVTVNLYSAEPETLLNTVVTAPSGEGPGVFSFGALPAGSYIVEVVAPAGRQFSPQGQGSDPGLDSDVDPLTGRTAVLTLTVDGLLDVDAGLLPVPTADEEAPEPEGTMTSKIWLPTISR